MTTKTNYGWLQGKTVRKGGHGSNLHTRSSTPQVQSTSSTIFGGGIKDPSGRTSEYFVRSMDDQCPVCKSDRYLNPKLRLLVSSCYHKMCESCIDRLFTLGPAPCPICNKVLRKLAFSPQTFEDLGVEKEVAVRRRIAKEFNKRLEDFDDLRSYNDYLEEVEDIAFNLINNIDIPATEARIAAYKAANAALTSLNIQREEAEALALKEQEDLERREREARAAQLAQQEQQEREERQREERELIDKLETSQKDAHKIVAKSRVAAAKRSSARAASSNANSGLLGMSFGVEYAKLLKTRTNIASNVPDEPHVPFQDNWYAYEDLYTVRNGGYDDIFSEAVRKDREGIMRAGGYRVEEAWNRALMSAVAGLDILPLFGLDTAQSNPEDVDIVMHSI
ncbi:CDK-activating kinase assembly factor MAT1-domain-containing protein [Rhodocollybia butyracea]|uniref:RNA polymerase II transcription factor B subunit 3 n=1 Tax=Rhodocollybia butyracea TaxID=206335 RepID=A0A9P5UBD4_9AGAR|nr:CDK-activating kinase assembly factor MAT1-domain-containing protein [Rhodocollybia butyracea]